MKITPHYATIGAILMILLKNQRLLIIAPHPDDEVLGCGGFIKRVKDTGGKVFVLFMTVGTTEEFSDKGVSTQNERIKEIEKVAAYLKFDRWDIAFPGNQYHLSLDNVPQKNLIVSIEKKSKVSIETVKPTIIFTPQISDYNQDHRAVTDAVFAATRPAPTNSKHQPKIVLGYESVPAEWSARSPRSPNFFIKLKASDLKAKIEALKLYGSQVRSKNHLRSPQTLKTLAHLRGAQSGANRAEAFYCYRMVM